MSQSEEQGSNFGLNTCVFKYVQTDNVKWSSIVSFSIWGPSCLRAPCPGPTCPKCRRASVGICSGPTYCGQAKSVLQCARHVCVRRHVLDQLARHVCVHQFEEQGSNSGVNTCVLSLFWSSASMWLTCLRASCPGPTCPTCLRASVRVCSTIPVRICSGPKCCGQAKLVLLCARHVSVPHDPDQLARHVSMRQFEYVPYQLIVVKQS